MSAALGQAWRGLFSGSDEQAMWQVKMAGDAQAFGRLMVRWEEPIRRLCTRMLGDPHRGEDLAQEAFARLYARRESYEPSGRFSTFLWRIALNLCHDEIRKIQRRREFLVGDEDESAPGPGADESRPLAPDEEVMERERAAAVRDALQQLAEPHRVVLVLRHYEGLKFREIADVLDVPEGTVKSRMAEALDQLTRRLQPTLLAEENVCMREKTAARP